MEGIFLSLSALYLRHSNLLCLGDLQRVIVVTWGVYVCVWRGGGGGGGSLRQEVSGLLYRGGRSGFGLWVVVRLYLGYTMGLNEVCYEVSENGSCCRVCIRGIQNTNEWGNSAENRDWYWSEARGFSLY